MHVLPFQTCWFVKETAAPPAGQWSVSKEETERKTKRERKKREKRENEAEHESEGFNQRGSQPGLSHLQFLNLKILKAPGFNIPWELLTLPCHVHISALSSKVRHIQLATSMGHKQSLWSCPHFLPRIPRTTNNGLISLIAHSSLWSVSFFNWRGEACFTWEMKYLATCSCALRLDTESPQLSQQEDGGVDRYPSTSLPQSPKPLGMLPWRVGHSTKWKHDPLST